GPQLALGTDAGNESANAIEVPTNGFSTPTVATASTIIGLCLFIAPPSFTRPFLREARTCPPGSKDGSSLKHVLLRASTYAQATARRERPSVHVLRPNQRYLMHR